MKSWLPLVEKDSIAGKAPRLNRRWRGEGFSYIERKLN